MIFFIEKASNASKLSTIDVFEAYFKPLLWFYFTSVFFRPRLLKADQFRRRGGKKRCFLTLPWDFRSHFCFNFFMFFSGWKLTFVRSCQFCHIRPARQIIFVGIDWRLYKNSYWWINSSIWRLISAICRYQIADILLILPKHSNWSYFFTSSRPSH